MNDHKRVKMINWEIDYFITSYFYDNISTPVHMENYQEIMEETLNKYVQEIDPLEIKSFIDYYGIFHAMYEYDWKTDNCVIVEDETDEIKNYRKLFYTLLFIEIETLLETKPKICS